ncbi:MAG: hypothetical protein AAGB13_16965 [Cyanobacteria bacterium P01_F01_bin.33]
MTAIAYREDNIRIFSVRRARKREVKLSVKAADFDPKFDQDTVGAASTDYLYSFGRVCEF